MVKIKLTNEEIEKIFEKFVKQSNTSESKPANITWRRFYTTLLLKDIRNQTDIFPDFYHGERIIQEIFNVPIKLGYFVVNFYDPSDEHYLLIRDCFNSQPNLFNQEALNNDNELNEQYQLFQEWKQQIENEKISYNLD